MEREVYIVDCIRTPLGKGKKGGALNTIRPVDLLAATIKTIVSRSKIKPSLIEDVIAGCVMPINEQGGNIGRLAALMAGLPKTVPGCQLDRACGSGQQAIHFVSQGILSGDIDIGIACGIEMMSVVPIGSQVSKKANEILVNDFPYKLVHQGISAELICDKYNITKQDCDDFAYKSHLKAANAINNGFCDSQIVKIKVGDNKYISVDEGVRMNPNRASMNKLRPAFKKNGNITAANASQISDGASALLLASKEAVIKYNLKVRARIIGRYVIGSDPILMLDGVIPATKGVLKQTGLNINDIDLFEVNEAFACVPIAWKKTLNVDNNKLNICGGACAHGHPLGATGSILMTKLVNDLERTKKNFGLQTMCEGNGMANATIVQRCDKVFDKPWKKIGLAKL